MKTMKNFIEFINYHLFEIPSVTARIIAFVLAAGLVGLITYGAYWATGFLSATLEEPFVRVAVTAAPAFLFLGWYVRSQLNVGK